MKKYFRFLVLPLAVLPVFTSVDSWADPNKPYDRAYADATGRKLERGVSNAVMGWMEIPRQITKQGREHGPAAACLIGPIVGLAGAVCRTASGAYEALTFPVAAPPPFQPVIQPEFVLDKGTSKS